MTASKQKRICNSATEVSISTLPNSEFSFGADAPQDAQDSQDLQGSQGNSKTLSDPFPSVSEALSGPLPDYLRQVYEYTEMLKEDDKESWHSPLFSFTRFCKPHRDLIDLPDYQAMQAVEAAMRAWDDLPLGHDPWVYFFNPEDRGEAQIEFMNAWNAIRHIPFRDVLHNALRLSQQFPLKAAHERGNLYDRFISLAGWLQWLHRERDIYLPTRTIDGLLACDQRTVSRLRRLAIRDGLLRVVKGPTFRSTGKSEATAFRFAIEHLESLRIDK